MRPRLLTIPATATTQLLNLLNQSYGVNIMPHHTTNSSLEGGHTHEHTHQLCGQRQQEIGRLCPQQVHTFFKVIS